MKYTKNLHNKLLLEGFEFQYEHKGDSSDDFINYTVYEKGALEITVCDTHKEVVININAEDDDISHISYAQLRKLDKIINRNDRTRTAE